MMKINTRKKHKGSDPDDHKLLPLNISSYDNTTLFLPESGNSFEKMPQFHMSTSGIEKQADGSNNASTSIINLFPLKTDQECNNKNNNNKEVKQEVYTHCQFKPNLEEKEMQFDNVIGKSFGYIICDTITTYFFDQVSYSEFTDTCNISKDVPLVFLYQQTNPNATDKFTYNSIKDMYKKDNRNVNNENDDTVIDYDVTKNNTNTAYVSVSDSVSGSISASGSINNSSLNCSTLYSKFESINKKERKRFFKELNDFFYENTYIQIINSYSQKKIFCLITMIIILLIIIGLILFMAIKCTSLAVWVHIIGWPSIIILCVAEWFLWKKKETIPFQALKEEMYYRYENVKKKNTFEKYWNTNVFEANGMFMIIPLSFHYVMFNMDTDQKIQIIPHEYNEKTSNLALKS